MDPALNHEYLAMKACSLGAGVVLDFGCGKAHVVSLLRSRGITAYGADVFWGGMDWSEDDGPYRELLSAGIVREIVDGKLPFENGTFDVIVSDQVFEHVDDLSGAAAEMVRVLKPTGRMYHQFPPKDILLEPHTKIPFAHRMTRRVRTPYLEVWRRLGFGRHPLHIDDPKAWAVWGSQWLDDYCTYRPRALIESTFRNYGFTIAHQEAENCLYRAGDRRLLRAMVSSAPGVAAAAFRALGCDCIELSRPTIA
jgi:SAM-dependent methyltransferase